jgi:hypothetical protein
VLSLNVEEVNTTFLAYYAVVCPSEPKVPLIILATSSSSKLI